MPFQQGPGPRPYWRPVSPQITAGPNIGPLGSFVFNSNAPQLADYGLIAGFAFVVASAVTPQGQANAAEYSFGTHAQAIYQAEGAKSNIWGSARTPPALSVAVPLRSIWASPESVDLSISGWAVGGTQANQGPVPPTIFTRQDDPRQGSALVWKSAFTPPAIPGVLGKFVSASQTDPTQLAAQIQQALVAAPIVANPTAEFFSIPPQNEYRPTSIVWRSVVTGQRPSVPPFIAGASQTDPSQLAPQIQPALLAAPVILGASVTPIATVPPQFDPSGNTSTLWTPSTFSPSAIIPPSGGGGGGILHGKAGRRWVISKPYVETILGEDADEAVFLESVRETIHEAEQPGKPELTRELATLSALDAITHAYNVHFETVAAARAAIEGRLVELEDDDLMAVLMILAIADEP